MARLSLTEPLIGLSDRPNWFGEGQSFWEWRDSSGKSSNKMLALMKECGPLADGQDRKQISDLGNHLDQRVQIFVERWCLVVPCEGHDDLLHCNGNKVECARNLWDRGTRVVWQASFGLLSRLVSFGPAECISEVVVGIARWISDELLTKKVTSDGWWQVLGINTVCSLRAEVYLDGK